MERSYATEESLSLPLVAQDDMNPYTTTRLIPSFKYGTLKLIKNPNRK